MGVNFTPNMEGYTGQGAFRFWCQKVLPLTFDDSLSYYELLNKVVTYLNNTIADVSAVESNVDGLLSAYNQLQEFVNDYFDNLSVQHEVDVKLDLMATDGTLTNLLTPLVANDIGGVVEDQIDAVVAEQIPGTVATQIGDTVAEQLPGVVSASAPDLVSDWLDENVDPVGSAVVVDSSLTISGAAADAKVTGDELSDLKTQNEKIEELFSDESTILSDALSDSSDTYRGITYSLSGNTFTASGLSTANSLIAWIAATSEFPEGITPGKTYILDAVVTGTGMNVWISIKSGSSGWIHILTCYKSGKYIFTLPNDMTQIRVVSMIYTGTEMNGSITAEICNAISPVDVLKFVDTSSLVMRGQIGSDITALSSLVESGAWFIPTSMYPSISDMPDGTISSEFMIINYSLGNIIYQCLFSKTSMRFWIRTITRSSVSTWQDMAHNSNGFGGVQNADADNIIYDGYYTWGSSNNAQHTPENAAAGALIHINRDNNTKYQVGINYTTLYLYVRAKKSGTWGSWNRLAYLTDIPSPPPKPQVIYEAVTSGTTIETLRVYIPVSSGYMLYRMFHFVDTTITENYDVWRLYHVYHVDTLEDERTDLTVSGEWECAIHLAERNDFSGGSTHGDEVMSATPVILINGVPTSLSSLTTLTEFDELRFIRTSNMYDPADHVTKIAEHGAEYVYTENGLTLNQSLKWVVSEALTNCYMAMFLPSKSIIDRACVNSDFETLVLPSTTSEVLNTIIKPNADAITMWDTGSGVSATVSSPIYPSGLNGGDRITITDNHTASSTPAYNKVYFNVCGAGVTSEIGQLWKSKTIYNLDYRTL